MVLLHKQISLGCKCFWNTFCPELSVVSSVVDGTKWFVPLWSKAGLNQPANFSNKSDVPAKYVSNIILIILPLPSKQYTYFEKCNFGWVRAICEYSLEWICFPEETIMRKNHASL